MIQGRTAFFARLGIVTVVVILTAPLAANRARPVVQEAPATWPLAAWAPIRENPVFAGTGRDTWDRKNR
jgi:hypothetical protein